jgi:hypothetical protein
VEKVIKEWRVIETDDGFRIEIKGDKDAMRSCFKHLRSHGPMHWPHHRMPFGPWHGHFAQRDFCCCAEDEESEEEKTA